MLSDDAFWAARRVAAFDDDLIRAIVHTGGFSDAAAEQHFAAVLIQRRDTVVHAYLPAVNPIVDPRLGDDGQLRFDNAAVSAGAAAAPSGYKASWAQFDNATGDARPLGETVAPTAVLAAPPELPRTVGGIVRVSLSATGTSPAAWQQPEQVYFRRTAGGWVLIGLDRGIGDATATSRPKQ